MFTKHHTILSVHSWLSASPLHVLKAYNGWRNITYNAHNAYSWKGPPIQDELFANDRQGQNFFFKFISSSSKVHWCDIIGTHQSKVLRESTLRQWAFSSLDVVDIKCCLCHPPPPAPPLHPRGYYRPSRPRVSMCVPRWVKSAIMMSGALVMVV